MNYEIVIGMEAHAQLATRTKMFCGCRVPAGSEAQEPNTLVCPVCLGLPGSLPVVNRLAVEYTLMAGLALNGQIAAATKWDRKNYHYPDLPKGYQISQYDLPLASHGWMEIEMEGSASGGRRIRIRRVHLEEDTAKLFHVDGSSARQGAEKASLLDFNRSGVPLIEVVSEPDLRSPQEAKTYAEKLRQILRYLDISTGNMEEGSLRLEANVSLRPRGSTELGTRTEIKNMNSFRAVERALTYEVNRQWRILEEGGEVQQETVGWDESRGITVVQRSKEYAHDYRYFPEPDLPPLLVTSEWIDQIRARLPELPDAKRERFMRQYALSPYDAAVLTTEAKIADAYEAYVRAHPDSPRLVAIWMTTRLFEAIKQGIPIEEILVKLTPESLNEILRMVESEFITWNTATEITSIAIKEGLSPEAIVATVEEKGLKQISTSDELAPIVERVLNENPGPVHQYLRGKETVIKFLIGQVMKATSGKANPQIVQALLEERLKQQASEGPRKGP